MSGGQDDVMREIQEDADANVEKFLQKRFLTDEEMLAHRDDKIAAQSQVAFHCGD